MKKQYVSPVITVEHYELTQTIAACTLKIGANGTSACVIADPDATNEMKSLAKYDGYFASCADSSLQVGDEIGDGICYHTNANAAFNS